MTKRFAVLLLLAAPVAVDAQPARVFSGGVFVSEAHPMMRIQIDSTFQYLGRDEFALKGMADVDRHFWASTEGDTVTALIVFQFEALRDSVDGQYRFQARDAAGANYRMTPERVHLGDHAYVHNTWAFDQGASAAQEPEAESARAIRFMEERGLVLDHALIMSRYVREVGQDSRKEIILFYMEPLSRSGYSLDDFPDGEPPNERYDQFSRVVVQRGLEAFRVLESGR